MSRFQCLMTRSSRLILAFSSASRSASQKAYRDKGEARTKSRKKKFVRIGKLTVRQSLDDHRGLTSNIVASFSAATTTPSIMGNARRFLNSNPVYVTEQVASWHFSKSTMTSKQG